MAIVMDTTVVYLNTICNDPFWNSTFTLTSDWPEFTDCFTYIVLSWPASIYFLLMLPFRVMTLSISSQGQKSLSGCVTPVLIVKCLGTASLAGLTIVLLALPRPYVSGTLSQISYAELAAHIMRVITYTLATFLIMYERWKHVIGSIPMFLFWTVLVLTDSLSVLQSILHLKEEGPQKIISGINMALYALILMEFVMCFFADTGADLLCGTTKNPWPEYYRSVPSRIFFAWLSRLVYIAWKRKLNQEDVYDISEQMTCDRLQTEFDTTWRNVVAQEAKDSMCSWESLCSRIIGHLEKIYNKQDQKSPNKEYKSSYQNLKDSSPLPNSYGSIKSTFDSLSETSSRGPQNGMGGSVERLTRSWKECTEISKGGKEKDLPFSLLKVTFRLHGPVCLLGAVFKIISDLTLVLQPVIVRYIITETSNRDYGRPMWIGVMLCLGLLLTGIIRALLASNLLNMSNKLGVALKSQLMSAIFRKTMRMSNQSRRNYAVGEVMTLMSVDAERAQELRVAPLFSGCFFVIICAAVLLYYTIGISMLTGITILVLLFPTNAILTSCIKSMQSKNMKLKEQRVRLITDVLKGIKVLKLYAWENSFEEKVSEIRAQEMKNLWKLAMLKVAMNSINWFAPFAVTLATFATYVLIAEDGRLDSVTAFVSLTFFAVLKSPLTQFTFVVNNLSLAVVSLKRINDFLHCEDSSPYVGSDPEEGNVISLREATFAWAEEGTPAVSSATLSVAPQSLTIVAGKVGSGKSSLLSGILGEMNLIGGSVDLKGSVAYVGQQAWIQNASVRDNILFGGAFDRPRYEAVLEACALVSDLMILPNGDATEIGEKGCNLSGGQKQRVALARAVYMQQDIYFMDDPLSAVDAHVGKHIFEKVIGPSGLLKDKTRILVTHGIHWLSMADTNLVMRDGDIAFQGTYDRLIESRDFMQSLNMGEINEDDEEEDKVAPEDNLTGSSFLIKEADEQKKRASVSDHQENSYYKGGRNQDNLSDLSLLDLIKTNGNGALTSEEGIEEGGVKMRVVCAWFKAGGICLFAVYFLGSLSSQAFSAFSGFWLKFWTDDSGAPSSLGASNRDAFYLGIYGVCGVGQLFLFVVASASFWASSVTASRNMHKRMLKSILRSPMEFFDTTPLGRLLNRFSVDIDSMDEKLPQSFTDFMRSMFQVLSAVFIVCLNVPLFIAAIVPIFFLFYMLLALYLPAARQLKRIESVSKSPIYTHFGEFVSGTATIRAFGHLQRFCDECRSRIDFSIARTHQFFIISAWTIMLTDLTSSVFVFGVAIFAVTSSNVDSGDTGLAISYSVEFTVTMVFMVRQATEITAQLICIERVREFSQLRAEGRQNSQPKRECDWPRKGQIEFKDYSVRYREGLDLVLKNITATVQPAEKVAIVGRTGAGKSSMTLALFRIIEAAGGKIVIDNVDIADVDLITLRSKLSILPQDPVLFSSSLRMNLDPYNEYSDNEVMEALQQAHLDEFVREKTGGLSFDVGEEGKNMSVGERQLVCLARALLRQNKILVLDEATAAVDVHTDSLIQETIRTAFKDCTILTIAHRINTIMDYDRVMVLADGELKEFAPLKDLLNNTNSLFYSLAKQAGLV